MCDNCEQELVEKVEKSHLSVSETVSNLFATVFKRLDQQERVIKEIAKGISDINKKL